MVFRDIEENGEVVLSAEDARKKFVTYIMGEMDKARSNLEGRFRKLKKWRRVRAGIPEVAIKNKPIPNASNVVTPLTMWLVNTIYGELYNTFALNEFWMIKSYYKDDELIKKAEVLTKWFNLIWTSPTDVDAHSKNNTIHYDMCSLGTCHVKYPYVTKEWKFMGQSEGGLDMPTTVTSHDGLDLITYPEEDVLFPAGAMNFQDSPWVSFTDHFYKHDLEMLAASGIFNGEALEIIGDGSGDQDANMEGRKQVSRDLGISFEDADGLYSVAEVYSFWDVDGDGKPEDIVVSIHLASGTVLREDFNRIGRRPCGTAKYGFVPYQLPGMGICQMADHMQDETDATHNQRIDNNKFANNAAMQARRGAGIKPNEQVYPGKVFMVDEIGDISPIEMGRMQFGSIVEENLATSYAQKATGVSEIMQGFADSTLKSRDTAQGQMLRLQQGKGMFAAVVDNSRDFYREMGLIMMYQNIHHRQDVMDKERKLQRLSEDDLNVLEAVLNIPIQDIPLKFQFTVRTRNIEETRDVQRNNLMMLTQLVAQYSDRFFQKAMMLDNPQIPVPDLAKQILLKDMESSTRIISEILELINIDNTDDYVLPIDVITEKEKQMKAEQLIKQLMQKLGKETQGGFINGRQNDTGPVSGRPGIGGAAGGGAEAALAAGNRREAQAQASSGGNAQL